MLFSEYFIREKVGSDPVRDWDFPYGATLIKTVSSYVKKDWLLKVSKAV